MDRNRYAARPAAELERAKAGAGTVGAWSTSLTATYETDLDVARAVLPPPLEPGAAPHVRISIATVDLGRGMPPFAAGTFAVSACHEGTEGWYPLLMPMSTEMAVISGRETFGEPKKLADMELERDGNRVRGTVTRMGTTIVEIAGAVIGAREAPPDAERVDFYLKFLLAPDGDGFDSDPALVLCRRLESTRKLENVDGEVVLRDSPFDPVADVPVRSVVEMTLAERRSTQTGEIVARVPGKQVLPYAHQRYDFLMRSVSKAVQP